MLSDVVLFGGAEPPTIADAATVGATPTVTSTTSGMARLPSAAQLAEALRVATMQCAAGVVVVVAPAPATGAALAAWLAFEQPPHASQMEAALAEALGLQATRAAPPRVLWFDSSSGAPSTTYESSARHALGTLLARTGGGALLPLAALARTPAAQLPALLLTTLPALWSAFAAPPQLAAATDALLSLLKLPGVGDHEAGQASWPAAVVLDSHNYNAHDNTHDDAHDNAHDNVHDNDNAHDNVHDNDDANVNGNDSDDVAAATFAAAMMDHTLRATSSPARSAVQTRVWHDRQCALLAPLAALDGDRVRTVLLPLLVSPTALRLRHSPFAVARPSSACRLAELVLQLHVRLELLADWERARPASASQAALLAVRRQARPQLSLAAAVAAAIDKDKQAGSSGGSGTASPLLVPSRSVSLSASLSAGAPVLASAASASSGLPPLSSSAAARKPSAAAGKRVAKPGATSAPPVAAAPRTVTHTRQLPQTSVSRSSAPASPLLVCEPPSSLSLPLPPSLPRLHELVTPAELATPADESAVQRLRKDVKNLGVELSVVHPVAGEARLVLETLQALYDQAPSVSRFLRRLIRSCFLEGPGLANSASQSSTGFGSASNSLSGLSSLPGPAANALGLAASSYSLSANYSLPVHQRGGGGSGGGGGGASGSGHSTGSLSLRAAMGLSLDTAAERDSVSLLLNGGLARASSTGGLVRGAAARSDSASVKRPHSRGPGAQ